jgi:O-6-methylguanine DNA methyltransferase
MTRVRDYPSLRIATPLGLDLMVETDGSAIVSSRFVAPRHPERVKRVSAHAVEGSALQLLRETKVQVTAYFKGKLSHFTLPLALEGTPFECDVWRRVAELGFGEFVSYADVARAVGRPLSHRGVARAMGNAPLALFIPAHRVVGADGRPRGTTRRSMRLRLIAFERTGNIRDMPAAKKKKKKTGARYWSKTVTEHSNALDLEASVFNKRSARDIALSLKRSAEQSKRRKASPYQSAMSMLNFYINRAGKNLSPTRKKTLERAKDELRIAFGREQT